MEEKKNLPLSNKPHELYEPDGIVPVKYTIAQLQVPLQLSLPRLRPLKVRDGGFSHAS